MDSPIDEHKHLERQHPRHEIDLTRSGGSVERRESISREWAYYLWAVAWGSNVER
jgi:hypothetical protein